MCQGFFFSWKLSFEIAFFSKENFSLENDAYLLICLAPVAPAALKMTTVEISDLTAEIDLWSAEQRNGPIRWWFYNLCHRLAKSRNY